MSIPNVVATVTLFGLWTSHGTLLAQQSKTAGESFKNIQVLKRVPADQWFDTMAFIAGSWEPVNVTENLEPGDRVIAFGRGTTAIVR